MLTNGTKWFGRISTVAAIAASLTFLATDEGGPTRRIDLKLHDAKNDYAHFQAELTQKVGSLLRQTLIDKAWNARTVPLQSAMVHAAEFQKQCEQFDEMRKTAEQSFHLVQQMPFDVPAALDIPESNTDDVGGPNAPDPRWTAKDLRQAARDADDLSHQPTEKMVKTRKIARMRLQKKLSRKRCTRIG